MPNGTEVEKHSRGLEGWAITERQFLRQEIKWLRAGANLISPSGENISAKKLEELEARLEHIEKVLAEQRDIQRPQ